MENFTDDLFKAFYKTYGKLIYTPGPTMVPERILAAMNKQIINPDLDPEFPHWFLDTSQLLGDILKTKNEVLILPGEGMLALDAALNSIVKKDDKVLVLASGIFGHGFAGLVRKCGALPVIVATESYNESLDIERVKEGIENNPDVEAITIVHCETPSGTLNPIKDIIKVCKKSGAITIVDAVSSIAGTEMQTDTWGIDINLGASQKCFSAPPGIAFMSLSRKAIDKINSRDSIPTFYSDLSVWTKSWIANRSLPYTHSISNLYSFRESINLILEEGLENVIQRHTKVSKGMIAAGKSIDLELYPIDDSIVSPSVTAFKVPKGIDSELLISTMWNKFGVLIAGAWGPVLGGKVLRFGNMGYCANPHFAVIALSAFEHALIEQDWNVTQGQAVETFLKYAK